MPGTHLWPVGGMLIVATAFALAACTPTSSSLDQLAISIAKRNINTPADTWYAHGSLHSETALAWQRASYQSKRATCADYLQAMMQKNMLNMQVFNDIENVDELKPFAETLVQQLNQQFAVSGTMQQNEKKYARMRISEQVEEAARRLGWVAEQA